MGQRTGTVASDNTEHKGAFYDLYPYGAACMGEDWVNAPSMWECYRKADAIFEKAGLGDHLAVHFHKEGHAVIEEDAKLLIRYFDHMYYKRETDIDMRELKTTVFAGQEH